MYMTGGLRGVRRKTRRERSLGSGWLFGAAEGNLCRGQQTSPAKSQLADICRSPYLCHNCSAVLSRCESSLDKM